MKTHTSFKHIATTIAPQDLLNSPNPSENDEYIKTYENVLTMLEEVLGKPYYSKEGFILYNEDNKKILELLKKYELKIDLTVTSPPYNIGKEYETNLSTIDYIQWTKEWIESIYAITDTNGSFWLNVGYIPIEGVGKAIPITYLLWDKIDFFLIQEIVWNYGAGVSAKKFFAPRNEKILFYVKNEKNYIFNLDAVRDKNVKYPNQKKNGKLRCNPLGKNPTDVWEFAKVTSGKNRSSKERTLHPAQYPLKVIDRIIKVSSNDMQVVLDPFSGSGTTGIAAHANHRIYLGIEIDQNYCDMSIERFENYLKEKNQATLF